MKQWKTLTAFALTAMLYTLPSFGQVADSTRKCFEVQGTSDYFFGVIEQDIPVEHVYMFKNNCSDTVTIDQARASCGCTAAVVSEKVIAPGKDAKIQVKFTPPKGTRGKVSKTVSLYLKGMSQPHTVLRFSADVKTDLDIQPSYVQLLASEIGKEVSGKATIKNVSTDVIEITEVTPSITSYADTLGNGQTTAIPLPNAKASIDKKILQVNESTDVHVTLTPMYKGQVNGSVRIKTKKNEATIQIFGVVRGKDDGGPIQPGIQINTPVPGAKPSTISPTPPVKTAPSNEKKAK